jgi:hypothetical protein
MVDLDSTPVNELDFPKEPFVNEKINERKNQIAAYGNQSNVKYYAVKLLKLIGLWNSYLKIRT